MQNMQSLYNEDN